MARRDVRLSKASELQGPRPHQDWGIAFGNSHGAEIVDKSVHNFGLTRLNAEWTPETPGRPVHDRVLPRVRPSPCGLGARSDGYSVAAVCQGRGNLSGRKAFAQGEFQPASKGRSEPESFTESVTADR